MVLLPVNSISPVVVPDFNVKSDLLTTYSSLPSFKTTLLAETLPSTLYSFTETPVAYFVPPEMPRAFASIASPVALTPFSLF